MENASLNLKKEFEGSFVFVDLGAGGADTVPVPKAYHSFLTVVSVDAADQQNGKSTFFRHEKLSKLISGQSETRKLRINRFKSSSSVLEPKPDLIERYGLESYYELDHEENLQTTTLPEALRGLNLSHLNFLKTDLEGLDFEVIRSAEDYFPTLFAIQCELRFEPFYEGEPTFSEVCRYLESHGFELVVLRPEYWKPKHKGPSYVDGRLAWCDCLFLKKRSAIEALKNVTPISQYLLMCAWLGQKNWAIYVLEKMQKIGQISDERATALMEIIDAREIYSEPIDFVQRIRRFLGRFKRPLFRFITDLTNELRKPLGLKPIEVFSSRRSGNYDFRHIVREFSWFRFWD